MPDIGADDEFMEDIPYEGEGDDNLPHVQTPEESDAIVGLIGEPMETPDAKMAMEDRSTEAFTRFLADPESSLVGSEGMLQRAQEYAQRKANASANPAFNIEEQALLSDTRLPTPEANYAANSQILNEVLQKTLSDAGIDAMGFFGYAKDFFDYYLLRGPISTFEELTGRTERKGRDILRNLAFLSPREFRKVAEEYAQEIKREGVVGGNNVFAALQLAREIQSKGYDEFKASDRFLAITTSVAPALATGLRLAGKGLKAPTVVSRITKVAGAEEGDKAAEALVVNGTGETARTFSTAGARATDLHQAPLRPSASSFTKKLQSNKIAKDVIHLVRTGAFGRSVPEEEIIAHGFTVAKKFAENSKYMMHDFNVADEGLGLYTVNMRFGKVKDGMPYKPMPDGSVPPAVEDIAKKVGGQVVPFDTEDLTKGFLIDVTDRISVGDLVGKLNPEIDLAAGLVRSTIGKIIDNPVLGSADLRDVEHLSTLAQMGESARAAVKAVTEPYVKAIGKVGSKSQFAINKVYRSLRDGDKAHMRSRFNLDDFAVAFKEAHPNGLSPTQRDIDAYMALAQLEEADYILQAVNRTNWYMDRGYSQSAKINGTFQPVKKVEKAQVTDDLLYDALSKGQINKSALPDGVQIFAVEKPIDGKFKFVTRVNEVRIIEPNDVMGYNVGGARINPNARYFIVLGKAGEELKSMMSAFTYKQAKKAQTELHNIQEAIKRNATDIDSIIAKNNGWNPDIQTYDDLKKFASENDWDLTKNILVKSRTDKIIPNETANPDIYTDMRMDDFIRGDLARKDEVLMQYGGMKNDNLDPVAAITSQYSSNVFAYSNRAYSVSAMHSWVKAVRENPATAGWLRRDISPSNIEALFRNAEITRDTPDGRRFAELYDIINRRLNIGDDSSKYLQRLGTMTSEFIFDATGKKVNLDDPTNSLLKIGFHSAFGFMNVSQFFMQGFQAAVISAINPVEGLKAAYSAIPLRLALRATDPKDINKAAERLAKVMGMSVDDTHELMDYIRTSGRYIVDGDAVEDGTGVGFGISGWMGESNKYSAVRGALSQVEKGLHKGLSAGLMPFRQGERLARLTGITTAFLEFKKANPKVSALSDLGRKWITNREQVLGFNMTGTSRGMVQSGVMKIPTQWLTYTMRSLEQVFVGRDLSVGERARLFFVLGPMFGGTGFGFASAGDYLAEQFGAEDGGLIHLGLRYGVMDALSAYLLGDNNAVSFGERLAPMSAVVDIWKKVTEESTLQTLGGPSGEITGNLLSAGYDALGSLIHGRDTMLTEDAIRVLRQPSGVDNWFKAAGIMKYGLFTSKNGNTMGTSMDWVHALTVGLGFTPLQITELYGRMRERTVSMKEYRSFEREIHNDLNNALRLASSGEEKDVTRSLELIKEIGDRVELSPLSNEQKLRLRTNFPRDVRDSIFKLTQWLFENDKQSAALLIERLTDDSAQFRNQ